MFVKNYKKINKQKRLFKIKIWAVKLTNELKLSDGKKIIGMENM